MTQAGKPVQCFYFSGFGFFGGTEVCSTIIIQKTIIQQIL